MNTSTPEDEGFPLLSHRTLPSRHRLWKSSPCPTMDLAFLTFKSSSTSSPSKGKDRALADDSKEEEEEEADDTIGLYRLGGAAPLVWQWGAEELTKEVGMVEEVCDVRGARVETMSSPKGGEEGGLGLERAKEEGEYRIDGAHWSPDGQYLAVILSPTAHREWPIVSILLGVHSGRPSSPPLFLPPPPLTRLSGHAPLISAAERPVFLDWPALDPPEGCEELAEDVEGLRVGEGEGGDDDREKRDEAARALEFLRRQRKEMQSGTPAEILIDSLPAMDKPIPLMDRSQPGTGGATAAAAAAAFGAAQANAGLPSPATAQIHSLIACSRLAPSLPLPPSTHVHTTMMRSLLVIGTGCGRAHLFLAGTIYLGHVDVSPSVGGKADRVKIVGVEAVSIPAPPTEKKSARPKKAAGTRLWFVWHEVGVGRIEHRLRHSFVDLKLAERPPFNPSPEALNPLLVPIPSAAALENVRLSTLTSHLFSASIRTLFDAISSWHEARDLGDRFVAKIDDAGRAHDAPVTARWQLGLLLFSGRPADSLRDFLSTKNTERALSKWESSTNAALLKLREAIYQVVVPAAERLSIIINDRRAHWFGDPNWRAPESIWGAQHADWLRRGVCILIEKLYKLEDEIRKEHVAFNHLAKWLRYEVDMCVHNDNVANNDRAAGDPKPWVKHDVLIVDEYLSDRLKTNPLDALLPRPPITSRTFRDVLTQPPAWLKHPALAAPLEPKSDETREKLSGLLDWLLGEPKAQTPADPPPPAESEWEKLPPLALVVALSIEFGELFRSVFQVTAAPPPDKPLRPRCAIGDTGMCTPALGAEEILPEQVRTRVAEHPSFARLIAHLSGTLLALHRAPFDTAMRTFAAQPTTVLLPLRLESGEPIKVLDVDFFDDSEAVLLAEMGTGIGTSYSLVAILLDRIFPADGSSAGPFEAIPSSRVHRLDGQYTPTSLALNGLAGRRTGCVLAGAGRSLDVFDLEDGEEEVVEDVDEDEEMQDA